MLALLLPTSVLADSLASDPSTKVQPPFPLASPPVLLTAALPQPETTEATWLYLTPTHPDVPGDLSRSIARLLRHELKITQDAVFDYLNMHMQFDRRTADVPVLGTKIEVDSEYLSYNLPRLWKGDAGRLVRFGPYIQNWRSARSEYDGHYGLRLQLPW